VVQEHSASGPHYKV